MIAARDVGLPQDWISFAVAWAQANACVHELWLFGSRAKSTARADSDVDLAIVLAPPDGATDWALGTFWSQDRAWREQLHATVGARHVSLELFGRTPDEDGEDLVEVRASAQRLWTRP